MAAPAGQLFPSVGNREDILDVLTYVDNKNTPISSSIARVGADITNPSVYSYLADSYSAPSTDGVVDSADVTEFSDAAANRVMLSARAQKIRRTARVSDWQANLADVAAIGRRKEFSKAIAKTILEVKRDVEATISSDNESVEGSGSVAYKTRGLGKWIATAGSQTDLPVPTSQATPSASINTTATASLTESALQNVLQSIYEQTGSQDRLVLVAGPSLKKAVTNMTRFTVNSTSNVFNLRQTAQASSSDRLVSNISFYEGDFSTVEIVTSLFLAANASTDAEKYARGYIMSPESVMLRYGRKPRFQELQDSGGGPRGLVDCIVSLAVMSPKNMGKFSATS
jgi:hypothetical protein